MGSTVVLFFPRNSTPSKTCSQVMAFLGGSTLMNPWSIKGQHGTSWGGWCAFGFPQNTAPTATGVPQPEIEAAESRPKRCLVVTLEDMRQDGPGWCPRAWSNRFFLFPALRPKLPIGIPASCLRLAGCSLPRDPFCCSPNP